LEKIPGLKASVYSEISKFPSVIRDLSLIIDKKVTYQDIKEVIENFNSEFIKDYKVVDTYEKDGSDKKTYTLSFTLSSLKSTLNDKIIQTTISHLISEFENKIQAQILES
jgi:phenylalanyl-tRNA synthetase beta chain